MVRHNDEHSKKTNTITISRLGKSHWSQLLHLYAPGAPTASRGRFSLPRFPYRPPEQAALLPCDRCVVISPLDHLLDLVDTRGIAGLFP